MSINCSSNSRATQHMMADCQLERASLMRQLCFSDSGHTVFWLLVTKKFRVLNGPIAHMKIFVTKHSGTMLSDS